MKKFIARIMVLFLALPLILQSNFLTLNSFADSTGLIDLNDCAQYSRDAVTRLASEGIIVGGPDHRFNPRGDVTRAQVVTFIVRALGLSLVNPASPKFQDVTSQNWSYQYVETAYKYGITGGTSSTTFTPDRYCTREELVTMLVRAIHADPEIIGAAKMLEILGQLKDTDQMSPWAKEPLAFAYFENIISGYQQYLTPKNLATREQTAVIIDNYLTRYSGIGTLSGLSSSTISSLSRSVVTVMTMDSNGDPLAQGSGFCIEPGIFLTNLHVVEFGSSFKIITPDGVSYDTAGIAAYDKTNDLAVLKTAQMVNIAPLTMGSINEISQGDHIFAIGSPLGLQNTVSDGIVSAIRQSGGQSLIQLTAPITHGSSGGPLFNMQGHVIGITSAGYDAGNLNFAVPIDYALHWISQFGSESFYSIPVIDMTAEFGQDRSQAVDGIVECIGDYFDSLQTENVEAFKQAISPDDPVYSFAGKVLDPIFDIYDLKYTVKDLKVTKLISSIAVVQVTYDVNKVNGPAYRDKEMLGTYTLENRNGQWLIESSDESLVKYLD